MQSEPNPHPHLRPDSPYIYLGILTLNTTITDYQLLQDYQ